MTDLRIRRFESGDGPAVRELHEVALRAAGDFVEGAPEPDLEDVHGHYLADDGSEILVGLREDRLVAMVAYHPIAEWILADQFDFADSVAELTRMRVHPDVQRQGLGTEIYEKLERHARKNGYDAFVLDVGEDNEAARAFYERQGFDYVETATLSAMDRTFRLAVYRKGLEERSDFYQ